MFAHGVNSYRSIDESITPIMSAHFTLSFYHVLHAKHQVHTIMDITHSGEYFKSMSPNCDYYRNHKKHWNALTTTYHYGFTRADKLGQTVQLPIPHIKILGHEASGSSSVKQYSNFSTIR